MRLASALLALATLGLLLASAEARAYPQFQFSTLNSRCQACHFSPVGGGLINAYGRFEAGDTISRGGDGSFLYGLWESPDWVDFGADFRYAALYKEVGDDPDFLHFPMQGDTYVRFNVESFSAYINIGPRAAPRTPRQSALRRMVSREHFVTWQPESSGPYIRAGRFLAPFGLRLADHTVYVRKYTGFHVLEETYNASGGYFGPGWEVHATAFVPADPFTSAGPREFGGVVYAEKMLLNESAAVGGQFRAGFGDGSDRYTTGLIGKYYLGGPELMFLGEVDLIAQNFEADSSPSRTQLATYLGLTYWPLQGVMITGAYERFDADLSISANFRDAYRFELQYFPRAHWEIHAMQKLELQGEYSDPTFLSLLMLHYYL